MSELTERLKRDLYKAAIDLDIKPNASSLARYYTEKTGVSIRSHTIRQWFRDEARPHLSTTLSLQVVFNVDLTYILEARDVEKDLMAAIRQLSHKDKLKLLVKLSNATRS